MSRIVRLSGFLSLLCLAVSASYAAPPTPPKNAPGTIVIVFKDGHRQSFNLSDIDRVEFGGIGAVAASGESSGAGVPSRGRFLGKWEVGDGQGNNFYITLYEDGHAYRSLGNVHGHWVYVDGEARATWDDGAQDAIRKVGTQFQKFAYAAGKLFTDDPDNVTAARNTTPHPI
jgi:hypothetical protein